MWHRPVSRPFVVAFLVLLAGCGLVACEGEGGVTDPGAVAELEGIFTERAQTVGQPLSDPLAVRALDASGSPVSGVTVAWATSDGELGATTSQTDANGEAEASYTLGTAAGDQTVTASAEGVDPVVFTITAHPAGVVAVSAEPDSLAFTAVGETAELEVTATDEFGNEVSDPSLSFASSDQAVATVDQAGVVEAAGNGSADVVVSGGGDADTVAVTVTAESDVRYELIDLGAQGAVDINNRGIMVGTDAEGAFLLEGDTLEHLGGLDDGGVAAAVDSQRTVVGHSVPSGTNSQHAVVWRDGVIEDLGHLGGGFSEARDINNAGVIVGESNRGGAFLAVMWDGDGIAELPVINREHSTAQAINDAGQIVGYASDTTVSAVRAVLWEDGAIQDLGTLGGAYGHALDINASGQVTGSSEDDAGIIHGFLWTDGTMTQLPGLGGEIHSSTAEVYGMNAHGAVVGLAWLPDATVLDDIRSHAVLWEDGEIHDLNHLIEPGSGWTLLHALAINDQGAIVGIGRLDGESRGFLLQPLP